MHIALAMLTFLSLSAAIVWQVHSLVKKTKHHNKIINTLFIASSILVFIAYNNPIYYFDKLQLTTYIEDAMNLHHEYAKYIFVTALAGGFALSLLALLPREDQNSAIVQALAKRRRIDRDQSVQTGAYAPENIKGIALSLYALSWWFAGKLLYIGIMLTVNS